VTDTYKLIPGKDNYCVMGNPIRHSLSPAIHTSFARQTGEAIHYLAILVDAGNFVNALNKFREQGGKGLSITLPFKVDAFHVADELSARARTAGAVNTLWFDDDGSIQGDNTDGIGLITDIVTNHAVKISNRRILVLGAGGAVQGILGPLLEQQPECIVVANRTVNKAQTLVQKYNDPARIRASEFDELSDQSFDIVINGTSASLQESVPPIPDTIFKTNALSYDLMYSKTHTVFQAWSQDHGATLCLDGLGMLVEQAAEAFLIWRGIRPDTALVIKQLREG